VFKTVVEAIVDQKEACEKEVGSDGW